MFILKNALLFNNNVYVCKNNINMRKIIYFQVILMLFALCSFNANGQFINFNNPQLKKEVELIKKSKLIVPIDEKAFDVNAEYAEVLKKYWTLSEIEIIDPSQLVESLKEGCYYLTLSVSYPAGFNLDKPATKLSYKYTLWKPYADELAKFRKKKGNKKFDFEKIANEFAFIYLDFDPAVTFYVNDIFKGEFFGAGLALNSGPGIFKNYVQEFQTYLQEPDKEAVKSNYFSKKSINLCNEQELQNVKSNTLYIPNTTLIRETEHKLKYVNNPEEPYDIKKIFEKYPGTYEVIDLKDLNEKIMKDENVFYYFVKRGSQIKIMNSRTGEIVYQEMVDDSFDFKAKDLKSLIEILGKLK